MCGFVGLTLLFRGLAKLWWYLDLSLLKRVLILTMDVLMNCLLSFMILLCLAQGSFPMLCACYGNSDSIVVFKLSPFIVVIDSIIDTYVQHAGSSVIHNIESWCGPHNLLHVFNAPLVIDENSSISRATSSAVLKRDWFNITCCRMSCGANFVHVNCPSVPTTYAFTGSCRVLLSFFVPLPKIDARVW